MKKLVLVVIAIAMAFSLTACGGSANTTSGNSEPTKAVFTPQGEKVTSKNGGISVLAPTAGNEMWQGIDWTVDLNYSDGSINIKAKDVELLYVRPSIWNLQGQKYDTAEKWEAGLASGEYEEWSSYSKVEPVTIEGVVLYNCIDDPPKKELQYITVKNGNVYGIQARCNKEEHREAYENLLKQVVLTIE